MAVDSRMAQTYSSRISMDELNTTNMILGTLLLLKTVEFICRLWRRGG